MSHKDRGSFGSVVKMFEQQLNTSAAAIGLTALLLSAVLIWHFGALFCYNLPGQNMTPALNKIVLGYVDPYFSQGWNLFAPDPGGPTVSATFRFKYLDSANRVKVTPWRLASSLFGENEAQNPLSSLYEERETYYGATTFAINEHSKRITFANKSHAYAVALRPDTPNTKVLSRLLMSTAPYFVDDGSRVLSLQIALRETEPESIETYFGTSGKQPNTTTLVLDWIKADDVPTLQ